jgi:NAD(P)-dependent dehydrogenase (short-subunit alcohol dehydrogenase family)
MGAPTAPALVATRGLSSGLGSLAHNASPAWEFAAVKPFGYNAAKAALNMLTVPLAVELKDRGARSIRSILALPQPSLNRRGR